MVPWLVYMEANFQYLKKKSKKKKSYRQTILRNVRYELAIDS